MPETGAWLALWNGFDVALDDQYNEWHAREHVPERLTVPGMLRATRWRTCAGDDGLGYFTLYEMTSTDVLASPQYQALLTGPTEWSRRMRPNFGRLLRLPCRVLQARAGVRGAALMSLEWQGEAPDGLVDMLRGMEAAEGIVSVQAGREDTDVAPLPWHGGTPAAVEHSPRHLLLVESHALRHLQVLAASLPAELAERQPVVRLHTLLTLHEIRG